VEKFYLIYIIYTHMWTRKMIIDVSFVIGSYYETLSYSNFHTKHPQDMNFD